MRIEWTRPTASGETVILVHGLWMTSQVMRPLAHRLKGCGYHPVLFSYHSLRHSVRASAQSLVKTLRQLQDEPIHLVGHSLGGLVILQALQDAPRLVSGRIVLLGSPVNGSEVARRLSKKAYSRWLIGQGAKGSLVQGGADWQGSQQLGVIAGAHGFGVGHVLGGLTGLNDGTVTVAETYLPGAHDSLQLKTSHTGLIVSRKVAQAVCCFLHSGHFASG